MICIGVKYCGGCMPRYDRPALVRRIQDQLKDHARFVPWQHPDSDLTMITAGCPNACADIGAVVHKPVFFITRPRDAETLIHLIRSENIKNELERLLPGKDRYSTTGGPYGQKR